MTDFQKLKIEVASRIAAGMVSDARSMDDIIRASTTSASTQPQLESAAATNVARIAVQFADALITKVLDGPRNP